MRAIFAGSLFLACTALLGGCSKYPEVPVATGDPCESLEPILAALPVDKRLDGLPATYRGCNVANGMVSVVYKAPAGSPSYEYSITVIDEKSKYLKSFAEPNILTAAMARARWDQRWKDCKYDVMHPTNHSRPMMMRAENFSICVYGLEKDGKRMLQTFALLDGLGYDLIQDTEEAAASKDIVKAWKTADFAFRRFKPLALR